MLELRILPRLRMAVSSFTLSTVWWGKVYKHDARHTIMTCVIGQWRNQVLKRNTSPFSPQKNDRNYDKAPVTYASLQKEAENKELVSNSLWLSKNMVDDGCSLGQTLNVMEEKCKSCDVVSPMFCVEQCDTWRVKRELREVNRAIAESGHRLRLLNAIKNKRRLAILNILWERPSYLDSLQARFRERGFQHSQRTIDEYLKPLLEAGLVMRSGKRFVLTLYGRKVRDAVDRYGFAAQLPIHSSGYEERILRSLLNSAKTRDELADVSPPQSLSRTLRRLLERGLMVNNSSSDRISYFRTKRALSLERLSPTQRRICEAIQPDGISARGLAEVAGISLRRVYKYLRSLRGKKLVFRRFMPIKYELTIMGRQVAEFLDEIAGIE